MAHPTLPRRPVRFLAPGLAAGGICLLLAAGPVASQEIPLGYYQHPALHGETVVFSSESDLWSVPLGGGVARRLTSHPAPETEPRFSPDGRWLAFTGRYDGGTDVYRMPAEGGPPERLTHESDEVRVRGWTNDGRILYASQDRVGPSWSWVLRIVDPETQAVEELPLADAREGSFGSDGTLYLTRFGLEVTGDNVRAYRGGAMAQLWRFRPGDDGEAVRMAPGHAGNLTHPMAAGGDAGVGGGASAGGGEGSLHLVSDESGVANLVRLDLATGGFTPLTTHTDFEVRGASLAADGGRIIYQHGADLRVLEPASGEDRKVEILLASDRARTRTRWIDDPMNWLASVGFAPSGDRVALTARGRLVVVGTGERRRLDVPLPERSRARDAVPGPEGDWIYAFVDAGGEHALWRFPAHGAGEGEALAAVEGHPVGIRVSPSGDRIVHWNRRGTLFLLDPATGRQEAIDTSRGGGYREVVWSPDGRYLALSRFDTPARRPQIVLLEAGEAGEVGEAGEARRTHTLTTDRYESYAPAFSPDGRWLWFLSDRAFTPTPGSPWGDRNTGPVFDQRTRIYALALQPGNPFPLAPRSELEETASSPQGGNGAEGREAGAGGGSSRDLPALVVEGLAERLFEAPVPPGNYASLAATATRLYLVERAPGSGPALRTLELAAPRPRLTTFGEGIASFTLSADGRRILVRRGNDFFIVPAGAQLPSDLADARVRAGSWRVGIEPAEEWRQMFLDAWRMQRDFLYDPELRGVDWEGARDRYAPLVERVGDRRELDDVLRQMVAELGVLHSQIRPGEVPQDEERAAPSFLGGQFEAVEGGLRIAHIYRTDPELPSERAPLARPGVDLAVGDLLTRVNGRAVATLADLTRGLAHQAGEPVRLHFVRGGGGEEEVTVHPVGAARDAYLRYADWVTGRREVVEEATEGRVGYLHLRAMGAGDMGDFVREFFANLDRDALIVDVRRNRGGNIDSWVIERLLRQAWSFWQPPGSDPYWNMQQAFRGHLVVLVDPLTYSDGETFAAGVRTLGLGPVIGNRTAGAGVWLSDTNRLVDDGILRAAQTPQFDAEGRWIVEGLGVDPDIEVENLPHATWRGEDAQLERAVAEVLRRLEREPISRPEGGRMAPFPAPADPVRPPPGGPDGGEEGELDPARGLAGGPEAGMGVSAWPSVPAVRGTPAAREAPVALVTGSTDGLGRALALSLAEVGYHLLIHGRNAERGAEVVAAIEALEGSPGARFFAADFASLAEVEALASRIREEVGRLDLLVNNAGVGPGAPGHERVLTPDGHELRFQVNYLAGYLLTRDLLPLLRASTPSRVVNVTSRNQRALVMDDLRMDRGYNGGEAYGRSKLAQILHVQDLAEAVGEAGVTAVAVHPAPAMDTELVREAGGTPLTTVADGLASVRNAIEQAVPSGTFFFEGEIQRAHDQAYDPEARRTLREAAERALAEAGVGRPGGGADATGAGHVAEAAVATPKAGVGAAPGYTGYEPTPAGAHASGARRARANISRAEPAVFGQGWLPTVTTSLQTGPSIPALHR